MKRPAAAPPPSAARSRVVHRVPFYETDAMGIVHHANYVRYLEIARIHWMDEHHRPYREYVAEGRHFATTHVELDYHRAVTFDEEVEVTVWLDWVRGASLRMGYRLEAGGLLVATGATEHAMVDSEGRARRIPPAQRATLEPLAAGHAPGEKARR